MHIGRAIEDEIGVVGFNVLDLLGNVRGRHVAGRGLRASPEPVLVLGNGLSLQSGGNVSRWDRDTKRLLEHLQVHLPGYPAVVVTDDGIRLQLTNQGAYLLERDLLVSREPRIAVEYQQGNLAVVSQKFRDLRRDVGSDHVPVDRAWVGVVPGL